MTMKCNNIHQLQNKLLRLLDNTTKQFKDEQKAKELLMSRKRIFT